MFKNKTLDWAMTSDCDWTQRCYWNI